MKRITTGVALLCIAASIAVFAERAVAVWRADHSPPRSVVTSGFEEESLFAVWRAVHGLPVYADATRLPYAAAYFNWLFYAAYADAVRPVVGARGDASLPFAGRIVTAGGALAGAAGLFWLLRRIGGGSPAAAGIAAFVYLGPLVGWWGFTVRPDVWAMAWETAALAVLLVWYQRRALAAVVVSALLFHVAWAFKQTYVTGLGAVLWFLLGRRQWRLAAWLSGISIGLWAATLLLAGPGYRAAFADAGTAGRFLLAAGGDNLADLLKKTFPLWFLATAALLDRPAKPACPGLAADARTLGLLGLLVGLPLAFLGGCKVGAYSNYYFSVLPMLALIAAGAPVTGRLRFALPAALGATLALQLLVASGQVGTINLATQEREHAAVWSVWQKEPEPRFAATTVFNLPWLSPASPPLVLAFNYEGYRRAGRNLEAGGIGGLISAGYFRTLLLPEATGATYDGGSLDHYTRGESAGGLIVFRRDDASSPRPVP